MKRRRGEPTLLHIRSGSRQGAGLARLGATTRAAVGGDPTPTMEPMVGPGDFYRYGPGHMPYRHIYTPPGIAEPLPDSPAGRARAGRGGARHPAPRHRARPAPLEGSPAPPRSSGGGIVGGAPAAAPAPAPGIVSRPAPSFVAPTPTAPRSLPGTTPAVAAGRAQPAFVLPDTELGRFVKTHYAPQLQRQVFTRLLQHEVDPSSLAGMQRTPGGTAAGAHLPTGPGARRAPGTILGRPDRPPHRRPRRPIVPLSGPGVFIEE
jgi:hypothetical protein